MASYSQWYVVLFPIYLPMIRVNASPLPLLRRRLRRREPPSLDWPRFWSTFSSSRPSLLSMPHHSPSKSPQAPRASLSKAGKDDAHDANIRNFAPVARIMKNALPENAKIAKEAKECMQECVSEFISFITSEGKPSLFFFFFKLLPRLPRFVYVRETGVSLGKLQGTFRS